MDGTLVAECSRMRIPLAVAALLCALTGCSSEDDDATIAGPPPSEPLVFEASPDTKNELAIERWGFTVDGASATSTYRAYGAKNEVLATVVQKHDAHAFSMSLTSPRGSASENVELSQQTGENGEMQLVVLVTENTFAEGEFPARVLARFKADSESSTSMTTGAGLLTGKSHPLVQIGRVPDPPAASGESGDPLVTHCNEATSRCLIQLIDARNDANGASGTCGLLNRIGMPILACVGAAVVAIESGPGAALACGGAGFTTSAGAEALCVNASLSAQKSAQEFIACDQAACAGGQ
jgi:hypothetical protein